MRPRLNTCRRSLVFGDSKAGTDRGVGWETIIIREASALTTGESIVGDTREAGTEAKAWELVEERS